MLTGPSVRPTIVVAERSSRCKEKGNKIPGASVIPWSPAPPLAALRY